MFSHHTYMGNHGYTIAKNNLHIESLVEQILDGKQKGFTISTWDIPRQHLDYEDIEWSNSVFYL